MSNVHRILKSRGAIIAVGLLFLGVVGLSDYLSGPEISFGLFYLAPLFVVTWWGGQAAGVFIAFCCAGAWFIADRSWPIQTSQPWIPYLNFATRLISFGLASLLVHRIKLMTGELETVVERRTVELRNEIVDRKRAEEKMRAREELFRQLAETINEVFWMTSADRKQVIYISPAYERIWGQTCASLLQSPGSWMDAIHPEDRRRVAKEVATRAAGQYNAEYRLLRRDGSIRWIHDRAFPITDASGEVYRIAGIAEDVTASKETELALLAISEREQARIGLDLHDGLNQLLVSIAFDCNMLQQRLETAGRPESADATAITQLLDQSITQARQLARGLYPVRLDGDGLSSALEELAANVSGRFKIQCELECPPALGLRDNNLATQLYRITQEAVSNAVRHARPGHIQIRLKPRNGALELVVSDDGIGLPPGRQSQGLGLHIMEYRTRTVGGVFEVQSANGGGTTILCSVPIEANQPA